MSLKVLMLGWEFPPHNSGGLGTACLGLTKAMALKDVELTFVLPRKMEADLSGVKLLFADSKRFKINLKTINSCLSPYMTSSDYNLEISRNPNAFYGRNLFEEVYRYARWIGEEVGGWDFDVIHIHDWMSFRAGMEAKRISGKPLIIHIHSTEVDRTGGIDNVNQEIFNIEKESMEAADKIIAVSSFTKKIIVENYHIPPEKIQVVHNGINLDDYVLNQNNSFTHQLKEQGNKIVLYVGRLTIQKGLDCFLQAAKKVLQFYPKVVFIIVGSGDMENQIIREAAGLGISDKVLFAGFLRGKELSYVYQLADLFVMPSVSEPFGLTALEAVASNTPVLLSKQSGVSEVLTHSLTVDFWDTEEMANKMLAVLNYSSLELTLKSHAREQVRRINWDSAAEKCIDIYRQVLDWYFKS